MIRSILILLVMPALEYASTDGSILVGLTLLQSLLDSGASRVPVQSSVQRDVLEIQRPASRVDKHEFFETCRLLDVESVLAQQLQKLHKLLVLETRGRVGGIVGDSHWVACARI